MKIALISEHASPLATLGGVDGGGQNVGQNVYVAQIAPQLGRGGHRLAALAEALGVRPQVTCTGPRPRHAAVQAPQALPLAAGMARS